MWFLDKWSFTTVTYVLLDRARITKETESANREKGRGLAPENRKNLGKSGINGYFRSLSRFAPNLSFRRLRLRHRLPCPILPLFRLNHPP